MSAVQYQLIYFNITFVCQFKCNTCTQRNTINCIYLIYYLKTAVVHSSYSSDISSIIAAYTVKALVKEQPDFGIYYAMDIVDLETVIHDLPQLNIDLALTDKILEKEETYEEGSI